VSGVCYNLLPQHVTVIVVAVAALYSPIRGPLASKSRVPYKRLQFLCPGNFCPAQGWLVQKASAIFVFWCADTWY
jgi:hypothetical protein